MLQKHGEVHNYAAKINRAKIRYGNYNLESTQPKKTWLTLIEADNGYHVTYTRF